jgi:hypothetical protein
MALYYNYGRMKNILDVHFCLRLTEQKVDFLSRVSQCHIPPLGAGPKRKYFLKKKGHLSVKDKFEICSISVVSVSRGLGSL